SPSIVLEDADINEAIDSTVAGAFGAVGQNCLGVQRIFVQENIYNRFKQQFVSKASQYKMGDKKDETTDMGPLISEKAAKRVEKLIFEKKKINKHLKKQSVPKPSKIKMEIKKVNQQKRGLLKRKKPPNRVKKGVMKPEKEGATG